MSTFVVVFPIITTLIAFIFAIKLGMIIEELNGGFIVNMIAVILLTPIPIAVYMFSRLFCDGLL